MKKIEAKLEDEGDEEIHFPTLDSQIFQFQIS